MRACFFVRPGSNEKRAEVNQFTKLSPLPGVVFLLYLDEHPEVNLLKETRFNRTMGDFNTEAFTLLAVAIVIIGLRTTARWVMVGPRNFQADDYLMLLACVSNAIAAYVRMSRVVVLTGSLGGVRAGNWRRIYGRCVVFGPCQQFHDR